MVLTDSWEDKSQCRSQQRKESVLDSSDKEKTFTMSQCHSHSKGKNQAQERQHLDLPACLNAALAAKERISLCPVCRKSQSVSMPLSQQSKESGQSPSPKGLKEQVSMPLSQQRKESFKKIIIHGPNTPVSMPLSQQRKESAGLDSAELKKFRHPDLGQLSLSQF